MNKYEVIIVGSGPTGLIAANLLGLYNIKTLLIEQRPTTNDIPRAILVDDETLRICQTIGLIDEVKKVITSGGGADYFAGSSKPFARVRPKVGRFGYYPRHKIHQPVFDKVLLQGLDRFPHVEVRFNTKLESFSHNDSSVTVQIQDVISQKYQQLNAEFLLGCDGGKSSIRKSLGIKFKEIGNKKNGSSFEEPWIILDLKNDTIETRHTLFYCNPPRPSMHAATVFGHRRYEFMLLPGEDPEKMLTDESLSKLVSPFTTFKPENVVKRAVVTFNALIAENFQVGRVLLLGDAAHLTPPFAGQGLNSGVRDSFNVAWKVAAVIKGIAHPSIINSYQEERKEHVEAMINLSVRMGSFILTTSPKRKFIRDLSFALFSVVPPLKSYVTEMKFKPKPICKQGLFIDLNKQPKNSIVGAMLKQPLMMYTDSTFKPLDLALGSGFALLKVGDPKNIQFPDLSDPIWNLLSPTKVSILPEDNLPRPLKGEEVVSDLNGEFTNYMNQYILVRPDRYVAGVFSPENTREFTERLNEILHHSAQRTDRYLDKGLTGIVGDSVH